MTTNPQEGVSLETPGPAGKAQGITLERPRTEVAAPGSRRSAPPPPPMAPPGTSSSHDDDAERPSPKEKIPLQAGVIRLPVRLLGNILLELTKYPGFEIKDQELEDFVQAWEKVGIEMTPLVQALLVTGELVVVKAGGYVAWKRQNASASAGQPPTRDSLVKQEVKKSDGPAAGAPAS